VLDEVEGSREHVAVIVGTQLFAGDTERRAWYACGKEVDAGEILVTEVPNVLLLDVPLRAILAESGAVLGLILDSSRVMEPGHLEAEGLATTTSTQF